MSKLDDAKLKDGVEKEKRLDPLLAKKKAMDKLLHRKRKAVFDFFSNKISMIFLIILLVGFIYGLYNNISTTVIEIQDNELGLNIIIAIIELIISFFIPVGFAFVYFGAKHKKADAVRNGMLYINKYFGFVRLIAILGAIGIGIFLVVALPWATFPKLLMLLLFLIFGALAVYVLNIFKKFIERIETEFNREYTSYPDGKNIRTYVIVVCSVYLVYIVLSIITFASVEWFSNLLPQVESMLTTGTLVKVYTYISFVITGSVLGFLLYYVDSYCKNFSKFNEEHFKLINKK